MKRHFLQSIVLILIASTGLFAGIPDISTVNIHKSQKIQFDNPEDLTFSGEIIIEGKHSWDIFNHENNSLKLANPDYSFKNPVLHNLYLEDIKYKNDNEVFAIGRLGTLMYSGDAGQTWEIRETPFNQNVRAIDIQGNLIVVVCNEGIIGISNDGGNTWTVPESGTDVDLRAVFIAENGNIYIAANAKTFIHSTDNGVTWQSIPVPDSAVHDPNNKGNWNFQSIWVLGDTIMLGTGLPGIPIQIVRSTDHGQSWNYILPEGVALPSSIIGAYLSGFAFADDGLTGYASYWMMHNNGIAKTTDGGATWAKITALENFTPFHNPDFDYVSNTINFVWSVATSSDGQKVISGGSFGQVFASTDAGASWSEIFGGPLYGDRDFRVIAFRGTAISPNNQSWLVSGQRGLIAGASDFNMGTAGVFNGEPKPRNFHEISFLDQNNGIAVGSQTVEKYTGTSGGYYVFYDGLYYTTNDGGETWIQQTGPGKENHEWFTVKTYGDKIWVGGVRYEYDYNEDDELIVIPHGVINYSSDAGNTWEEQVAIAGRRIRAINLWNDNYLYAVTDGNSLLRSLQGEAWETLALPEVVSINDPAYTVELIAPEVLLIGGGRSASGGRGYIIRSEDAGEQWSQVFHTGTAQGIIKTINFVDGRFGYAGGQWGSLANRRNILYSSDYGLTWQEAVTDGSWANYNMINHIAMTDSISAFGFGNTGYVMQINDGENFQLVPRFTEQTLIGGITNGNQQMFVVGADGAIVKNESETPPNSAPSKFAAIYPVNGEEIFIPWDENAVFEWEESADHDGGTVTYVFILESSDGSEELFRSESLSQNEFAANTGNFPSIPPTNYRWRVEAKNDNELYSTSYPALAFIDVDNFINDQNDIVSFTFDQEAFPSEIDNDNHTIDAHVIYGTDITSLIPNIEISHNATIDPPADNPTDFSVPVSYLVTAQNGDEQQWVVTVHIADPIDYITILDFLKIDYAKIPQSQLPVLDFSTDIINEGHRDVTQVTLNVTINDDSIISTTPLPSLPMGQEATLAFDSPYELSEFASYHFRYAIGIAEDEPNLIGHTAETSFELTDTVYAKDTGIYTNSLGSNSGPVSIGNIYEIINEDQLTSVSIGWGANLPAVPLDFTISIYKVDMETLTTTDHVYTSGNLERLSNMATTIVSYPVPDLPLEPGHYAIVVNQLTSVHIRVAFSSVTGAYFYIYDAANNSLQFVDDDTFGYLMIRANFGGLPMNEDATLTDILIDNQSLEDFDPAVLNYTYTLPQGSTQTPEVAVVTSHENAWAEITPAADVTSQNPADRTTYIMVTAEDGETNLEYSVEFLTSTSVPELNLSELKIYPNPARDFLYIDAGKNAEMDLRITSLDGKVHKTVKLSSSGYRLDISSLPAGLYILQLSSEDKVINEYFSVIR